MANRRSNVVLVDKLDEHDDLLLRELPDEAPRYVANDDFSDWYFNRLDQEAETY